MNTLKVEIDIPYDLLTLAHVSSAEIGQKMKEWSVLHLFLEGSISSGKAAELLGIDKATFLDLLSQGKYLNDNKHDGEISRNYARVICSASGRNLVIPNGA